MTSATSPLPSDQPAPAAVKVLYVLGSHRSGTTVLSNLLGQQDGFTCIGELRALWRVLQSPDERCGCSQPFLACPLWSKVLGELFGAQAPATAAGQMFAWQNEALLQTHTWRRVIPLLRGGRSQLRKPGALTSYAVNLTNAYRAVAEATGARLIIDSSKEPTDGALVGMLPGIDAYFVQLVRDPRGLLYSRYRREFGRGSAGPYWRKSTYSGASWVAMNLAAAQVRRAHGRARSLLLRYEDFVREPEAVIDAIGTLVGEPIALDLAQAGVIDLEATHTVAGNPNRFRTGAVKLQLDEEWTTRLNGIDRALVSVLCAPLLTAYRYPLVAGSKPGNKERGM